MSKREKVLYDQMFGDIPNDQLGRIAYILGKRVDNEKFNKMIEAEANKIKKIKWKRIQFTMWKIIKPSARPRVNTQGPYIHMYVPGAAENGADFNKMYNENNLPYINTPCIFNLTIYEKTPSSFNTKNKVLAELGFIRPWRRTGDFDNYAKSVADAIQHGMLEDDCLVIDSNISLRYSIKPHADIDIKYMAIHPDTIIFPKKEEKK